MRNKFLIIVLAALMLFVACKTNSTNNGEKAFTGEYIISAKDAVKKIGDKNTIFIDARGGDDKTIEGAISLAWPALAISDIANNEPGWGIIPSREELAARLSSLGIDKDKDIILFSTTSQGWGEDGRILWELEAAGYDDVKMVDGGVNALIASGAKMESDPTTLAPAEVDIDEIDRDHVINTDELTRDYAKYVVVDSREKNEYDGAVLYGETKGGHLPGAINIPFTSLFNSDGYLKSNDELKKLFKDAGLKEDQDIVTYCTGGIRSAYMQLVMDMCGYDNVKNYEGSYYSWSAVNDVE